MLRFDKKHLEPLFRISQLMKYREVAKPLLIEIIYLSIGSNVSSERIQGWKDVLNLFDLVIETKDKQEIKDDR